jgi:glutamyl-tRNA reductase
MLGEQDPLKIKIIDELTKAVVEGIISEPMNNLRRASEQENDELLKAASKLFDYKKKE